MSTLTLMSSMELKKEARSLLHTKTVQRTESHQQPVPNPTSMKYCWGVWYLYVFFFFLSFSWFPVHIEHFFLCILYFFQKLTHCFLPLCNQFPFLSSLEWFFFCSASRIGQCCHVHRLYLAQCQQLVQPFICWLFDNDDKSGRNTAVPRQRTTPLVSTREE